MKSLINIFVWNKIFKRNILCQYAIDFLELNRGEDNNFIYKYLGAGLDKV